MERIVRTINDVIGKEGRYANNPHDAGGETMWGITIAVARRCGYVGSMRDMPRTEAERIYMHEYVLAPKFDRVFELSHSIAEELIDTGVNAGVGTASKMLQRCLNTLNLSHTPHPLYPDLVVDGGVGAATLGALRVYLTHRKAQGELVLLRMLNALQGAYYVEITERRERNEEFIYGWLLNRVVI